MFCENCGNKLVNGIKFCPMCGNQIRINGPTIRIDKKKKNRKRYLIGSIIITTFILVLGALQLIHNKLEENSELVLEDDQKEINGKYVAEKEKDNETQEQSIEGAEDNTVASIIAERKENEDIIQTESDHNNKIPNDAQEYAGHYYAVYDLSLSWQEAENYCVDLGGHLVSINSEGEQDFIEALINSGAKNLYWLGANNLIDEDWVWSDGSIWSYTNWAPGEPSGYDGNGQEIAENYLQMYAKKYSLSDAEVGEWNDAASFGDDLSIENFYSLENAGFICEWGSE